MSRIKRSIIIIAIILTAMLIIPLITVNTSTPGNKTVTVSYCGKTVQFEVVVDKITSTKTSVPTLVNKTDNSVTFNKTSNNALTVETDSSVSVSKASSADPVGSGTITSSIYVEKPLETNTTYNSTATTLEESLAADTTDSKTTTMAASSNVERNDTDSVLWLIVGGFTVLIISCIAGYYSKIFIRKKKN